jgi:hypothetical protein
MKSWRRGGKRRDKAAFFSVFFCIERSTVKACWGRR